MPGRRSTASIDSEIHIYNAQIDIQRRRVDEYQQLLEQVSKNRDSAKSALLELQKKQKDLEAQKVPFNWLPNELLVQIFLTLTNSVFIDEDSEFWSNKAYHSSPVSISHVCQRWRGIAKGTAALWTHIIYNGQRWAPKPNAKFIQRSGIAPLEVVYHRPLEPMNPSSQRHLNVVLNTLSSNYGRLVSFTMRCESKEHIEKVIREIHHPGNDFSNLRYLELLADPNCEQKYKSMSTRWATTEAQPSLTTLKLGTVPLPFIPGNMIANLRKLQLTYPPSARRRSLKLFASDLCKMLRHTPLLEEITLSNTIPIFDIFLKSDDGDAEVDASTESTCISLNPVTLSHLKKIEWSYPTTSDIHNLMPFLDVPVLEKLDLWVGWSRLRWHSEGEYPEAPNVYTTKVIEFPNVWDISLQLAGDHGGEALRRFLFPNIKQLVLMNFNGYIDTGSDVPSVTLPSLESLFRDPRLQYLTHLTLSNFRISREKSQTEALLGYMPVLASLSLEKCVGLRGLMKGLEKKTVVVVNASMSSSSPEKKVPAPRYGVKFCPRLEMLSFWGCDDLEVGCVLAVAQVRNGSDDSSNRGDGHGGGGRLQDVMPVGAEVPDGENFSVRVTESPSGKQEGEKIEVVLGRKIKPLKKRRQPVPESTALNPSLECSSKTDDIFKTAATLGASPSFSVAMEDAFPPAKIVSMRFESCKLVGMEDAMSLKNLGVLDVVWDGGN